MRKLPINESGSSNLSVKQERRKHPRISDPVPIIVRRSRDCGAACQFTSTAKDIGAGGVSAFAPRIMQAGEKVTVFVRFALAEGQQRQAPSIAARAVVARVEENCDGSCIFAASFLRYRFI